MAKIKTDKLSMKELRAGVKEALIEMNLQAETGKQVTNNDADFAVKAVAGVIFEALKNGKNAGIHGLGTWDLRERKSRMGRNPQTGEHLEIKGRKAVGFSPSGNLKEAVK